MYLKPLEHHSMEFYSLSSLRTEVTARFKNISWPIIHPCSKFCIFLWGKVIYKSGTMTSMKYSLRRAYCLENELYDVYRLVRENWAQSVAISTDRSELCWGWTLMWVREDTVMILWRQSKLGTNLWLKVIHHKYLLSLNPPPSLSFLLQYAGVFTEPQ